MSKIKLPQAKKQLSLKKDRRNIYGENDKASRKNIPLHKQNNHQEERRAVNDIVSHIKLNLTEDDINYIEAKVIEKTIDKKRKGFKKIPDKPLGEIL